MWGQRKSNLKQENMKKMTFKNVELATGDLVEFVSGSIPVPSIPAVVIDVKDGVLEVMSTFLVIFQHSGKFTPDEVLAIEVILPAAFAIPQESRGRNFTQFQKVTTSVNGQECQGKVIAAFDGIVVAQQEDGELVSGGALRFEAAPTAPFL